ncbi:hypothetical protein RJ640_029023 [Escallonia rubra]|uniref:Uncharacterized protein n=1 Tax=Escallonia rubra TaxID=112253 RepID=A0AA88S3J6_9ASTE|nr:hypothetical protein RJ640_029023 [Escallonia rubra]
MFNKIPRIFSFDEHSLNSSARSSTTPSQSTTTINDYSLQSCDTQGSSHGIFEDHPGLNPSSERIVELQSDIREKLGELMINKDPQDVLVAAEALHAESDNIPFLQYLLNDLNNNGVAGEAYKDALDLAKIIVPSPLEQFEIIPLIPMNIGNFEERAKERVRSTPRRPSLAVRHDNSSYKMGLGSIISWGYGGRESWQGPPAV